MSRITKWKLEKTKVKVVFRLQFHATHIPSSGWEKLFISSIPTELGKTTAKTTKANVRNGTCKWADPIYETTRLLQDTKTKQYDEKLYKLVVSMGSSRTSTLGEATINLADYADALKPFAVAVPLHGCNYGTILHVTVQLLTSKTGFREFEQQRELRESGLQMGTDSNRRDESANNKVSSSEASATDQMDKVNSRVRFRPESKELPSREQGLNEEYADSAVGYDGSSNTSESLYAEKHDTSSTHEIDSLKSTVSGDLNALSHCQSPQTEKGDSSDHQFLPQGRSEWVQGWGSDYSVDNDLTIAYEENNRLRGSLEVAESSVCDLKMEVSSLQSYADELGGETQKFASQLESEIASGEELAKEILVLKSECSKFKEDLERLKNHKLISPFTSKESSHSKQDHLLQEKHLTWLKGLSVVEDKVRELQRKACLGFDERDFSFLHSDLEVLLSILQDFKHGRGAESLLNLVPSEQADVNDFRDINLLKSEQFVSGTGFGVELYQPESMLHYVSLPSLVSQESEPRDATDAMECKTFELLRELDEAKVERETLARKLDQMECYYESLVQELEENQKQMLGELQNLRNEHSICLYTISTKKAEMESICLDMNEQVTRFSEERRDMDSINKELGRRVVTSEAALKRARLNYSIAVDQLQKDLELLSFQVLSMFETNQNLMKQAFSENLQPCCPGYLDAVQKFEKFDVAKLSRSLNQSPGIEKQLFGGDILVVDMKKSLRLQEDLYQKVEEELCEMHSTNIYLDVFSKILQETLVAANSDIRIMKENIDKITQHLELTTKSREVLMARLQTAMNDIHTLNEYKAISISKSNDMLLQNQISEAKLESVSMENRLLKEKIMECEVLMKEYKSFQRKYVACFNEKSTLENLLKLEAFENGNLQSELSSLKEKLKILDGEFNESVVTKENMQKIINFLQDKLGSLLSSYDKQLSGQTLLSTSHFQESEFKDFKGIIIQLEENQHNACKKILQLMEEKKDLQKERDIASVSSSTFRSEILGMKQKFKHDIQEMEAKLDVSNTLVGKLQIKLESVANKFHTSAGVEDRYAQQNEELFTDLALVELQLQEFASKNKDLGQEILGLGTMAEELGRSKMTIAELTKEKKDLAMLLEAKTEESVKFASDLDSLKDSLRCVQDELRVEKGFRDKVEGTIKELGSCKMKISELIQDKQDITMLYEAKTEETLKLASDLDSLKERLRCLQDDFHIENDFRNKLECTVAELESSKMTMAEIMPERQDLAMLLEAKTEECLKLASDLDSSKESLKCLQDALLVEKGFRDKLEDRITDLERSKIIIAELIQEKQEITMLLERKAEESVKLASDLESLRESLRCLQDELHVEKGFRNKLEVTVAELERSKMTIAELIQYKQGLTMLLEAKAEESDKLASLDTLKESLRCLQNELHVEKGFRDNLEATVAEITSQVKEEQDKLLHLDQQNAELVHFRQLALDLDIVKSRVLHLSLHHECQEKLSKESSCLTDPKSQLSEMHEHLLAAEVEFTFVKTQYNTVIEELLVQLKSSDGHHIELQKKHLGLETVLNHCLASEAHQRDENAELVTTVQSLRYELEASVTQNRVLSKTHNVTMAQLEEYKRRLVTLEDRLCQDNNLREQLEHMLKNAEDLNFSNAELEIIVIVLKAKLDEQHGRITLMEESNDKFMKLRNQFNELTRKLSEQVLRTEEFKNLSVHFKELKDKAEAECLLAREKREPEGPSVAMQDSLRIAFIKEQYETRLQELRQQLSISKKHGEEMLWKLQDVVDEIENRKKSEASHLRRNEELSIKVLELEADLQSVFSDKREKINAYDRIKTELDCTLLSLECCKEEKEMLEASLRKCQEEKSKITVELTLRRGQLKDSIKPMDIQKEVAGEKVRQTSDDLNNGKANHINQMSAIQNLETSTMDVLGSVSTANFSPEYLDHNYLVDSNENLDTCSIPIAEAENSTFPINVQSVQVLESKGVHGTSEHALLNQATMALSNSKNIAFDIFQAQSLKSSIEHLHEELERMKNENSPFPRAKFEPYVQDLQREVMHLREANQELGSIFPLFNDFTGSGNALERVLALEIELAEALRAKKKSSFHIQSSFLKQHSDEESVFRSFRDINELIEDMLELKVKYAGVETELKEMHDRYSDLSLQFAEVEGERQKLVMTLKNIRTSKKLVHLNRSSLDTLCDNPL